MTARVKTLAIAFTALALACGSAEAQHYRGGYGGGYHGGGYGHGWGGGGLFLGGIGLGIGLGLGSSYYRQYDYYRPYDYVVVAPPPAVYYSVPPVTAPAPLPAPAVSSSTADPVFYPKAGQSAAQIEADRQACNRWATTQANAMADASVFHRATLACMDGRGYSSR